MFDLRVREEPTTVLEVSGSVDFYSAAGLLRRAKHELLRPSCDELSIDLQGAAYLSFEGLGAILEAYETGRRLAKPVRVVGAHDQPAEIIELSGLSELLAGKLPLSMAG